MVCTAEREVGGRTEDINREAIIKMSCHRDAQNISHKGHMFGEEGIEGECECSVKEGKKQ